MQLQDGWGWGEPAREQGSEAVRASGREGREGNSVSRRKAARPEAHRATVPEEAACVVEGTATRPIYCLFYWSGLLGLRPGKLFQAESIAH